MIISAAKLFKILENIQNPVNEIFYLKTHAEYLIIKFVFISTHMPLAVAAFIRY